MAVDNVYIYGSNPSNVYLSRNTVDNYTPKEEIRIHNKTNTGVTLNEIDTSKWGGGSSVTLGPNSILTLISLDGVNSGFDIIKVNYYGEVEQLRINFAAVDDVPDEFSVGADLADVGYSVYYYSSFVVSGISVDAPFSTSNSEASTGGSGWVTSGTISPDSSISLRIKSSDLGGGIVTGTLNINGVYDSRKLTTVPYVYFKNTLPITTKELQSFFGGDAKLTSYRRGFGIVRDIYENRNIAQVGNLSQISFRNAAKNGTPLN
jgi:hypothetical protein